MKLQNYYHNAKYAACLANGPYDNSASVLFLDKNNWETVGVWVDCEELFLDRFNNIMTATPPVSLTPPVVPQ